MTKLTLMPERMEGNRYEGIDGEGRRVGGLTIVYMYWISNDDATVVYCRL